MDWKEYLERYHSVESFEQKAALLEEAKERENVDRELFARKRQCWDVPELDDAYKGLVPVFDPDDGRTLFKDRKWFEEEEAVPRLFDVGKKAREKRRQLPATVESLKAFEAQFLGKFGHFLLDELNWDNVVVAGGAIVACLEPLPEDARKDHYDVSNNSSDIDLFLYGLSAEKANLKLVEIYNAVCNACPEDVVCFRSAHAVTMVSQYPYRHVQVVLRIYSSPYEVLAGFDVDSCTFLYNGKQVYTTPRGHHALMSGYNMVDVSRRSPSYEMRLAKYASRGFEVLLPGYKREFVNLAIFTKPWAELKGLEKLLVLEVINDPFLTLYYSKLRNHTVRIANSERYVKTAGTIEESEYATLFIPWGPGDNAQKVLKYMINKDIAINSDLEKAGRTYLLHPCFFGTAEEILEDCSPNDPPIPDDVPEEALRGYVRGKLEWMNDNPGRQQVGSFNPITDENWRAGALFQCLADKVRDMVARDDLESLQYYVENQAQSWEHDCVDAHGRNPLHVGLICGATRCCQYILDAGLASVDVQYDGMSALHLVALYNRPNVLSAIHRALGRFLFSERTKSNRKGFYYVEKHGPINRVSFVTLRSKFQARLPKAVAPRQFHSREAFVEDKANNCTALMIAVALGHEDVAKILLEQFSANPIFAEYWRSSQSVLELVHINDLNSTRAVGLVELILDYSPMNSPEMGKWLDSFIRRCVLTWRTDSLRAVFVCLRARGRQDAVSQSISRSEALKLAFKREAPLELCNLLVEFHSLTLLRRDFESIPIIVAFGLVNAWELFISLNPDEAARRSAELDEKLQKFLWVLTVDADHDLRSLGARIQHFDSYYYPDGTTVVDLVNNRYAEICAKVAELDGKKQELQATRWIGSTLEEEAIEQLLPVYEEGSYEAFVLRDLARPDAERRAADERAETERLKTIASLNETLNRKLSLLFRIGVLKRFIASRVHSGARSFLSNFVPRTPPHSGTLQESASPFSSVTPVVLPSLEDVVEEGRHVLATRGDKKRARSSSPPGPPHVLQELETEKENVVRRLFKEFKGIEQKGRIQDPDGRVLRAFKAAFAGDTNTVLQICAEGDLHPPASILSLCDSRHETVVGMCISRSDDPVIAMEAILTHVQSRYVPEQVPKRTPTKSSAPPRIDNLLLLKSGLAEDSSSSSDADSDADSNEDSTRSHAYLAYAADLDRHSMGKDLQYLQTQRANNLRGGQHALLVHPSILFSAPFRTPSLPAAVRDRVAVLETILNRILCRGKVPFFNQRDQISLETYAIFLDNASLLKLALATNKSNRKYRGLDVLCVALDRPDCLRVAVAEVGGGSWWQQYGRRGQKSQHTWVQIALACGSKRILDLVAREEGRLEFENLFAAYLANDADDQAKVLHKAAETFVRRLKTAPKKVDPSLLSLATQLTSPAQLLVCLRVGTIKLPQDLCFLALGHAGDGLLAYLLERGLLALNDLNVTCPYKSTELYPVQVAAKDGELEMVTSLLMEAGADPKVRLVNGANLAHLLCSRYSSQRPGNAATMESTYVALRALRQAAGDAVFLKLVQLEHVGYGMAPLAQLYTSLPSDMFEELFEGLDVDDNYLQRQTEVRLLRPSVPSREAIMSHVGSHSLILNPNSQKAARYWLDAISQDDPDWTVKHEDQNGRTLVDHFLHAFINIVLEQTSSQVENGSRKDLTQLFAHPLWPFVRRVESERIVRTWSR